MHLTQIRYQVNTIFSKNSCLCPIQTCMKAVQVCFAHLVSLFPLLEANKYTNPIAEILYLENKSKQNDYRRETFSEQHASQPQNSSGFTAIFSR